ncbi:glycosyltransferase family 2 protein [Photorhabdus kayaii]|uniref:glycosyltransferase family 2 protein n=1 Tax=Photorhabdus kayaii TaxID=230088 RepID=UPI0021D4FD9A|nr:glycosyltransferase family A protein [Photorhabdus kayaii]MCT8350348.1 glycosyltransferase family 2 protein [Photorhabdus kayaii]
MLFSDSSDVTLVITSCGRFDLLKQTIESFDKYNSYPIKEVVVTEDSGDKSIHSVIPEHWLPYCEIILNNPKLGQIKSIDLAYSKVKTDYIFHCEDDWLFYRDRFIEDSFVALKSNKNILQVWLRDLKEDVMLHYPFHYPSNFRELEGVCFSTLESNDPKWRGFSFNPGLRRKSDYELFMPYNLSGDTEMTLSKKYAEIDKYAVILDKSAVKHIGWDDHINTDEEIRQRKRENRRKIKYFTFGVITGCFLMYFIKGF